MLTYVVAFLLALTVAAITTPIVAKIAHKKRWLDVPSEARKIHTRAVPRLGGVAVVLAFFTPILGLAIYTNRISGLLYADAKLVLALGLGAAAIVTLGVYDDLKNASPKLKLTVQGLVAIGMWAAGFRWELMGNPFGESLVLGDFSLPVTVLWIVGIVNALNLIDGLDGLAAGVALFASVVLFGVAFVDHYVLLCLLTVSLAGSLTGFLFFNFNPARIFLGDSGSMFLGFILAMVSLWTQQKTSTAAALIIPILALGLPILDTTLSFVRRLGARRNPFKADKEHVHHRLMALGLSHRGTVLTLYTTSGIFALAGLAMLDSNTSRQAIALSTVMVVVVLLVRRIGIFSKPKSTDRQHTLQVREQVRATARQIRASLSGEQAWTHLEQVMPELEFEEVKLSWRDEGLQSASETVYRWSASTQSDRTWKLDTVSGAGVLSLSLEEDTQVFGELKLLLGDAPASSALLAELLRDALIDFRIAQTQREQNRTLEQVVHLAERVGRR